MICNVMRTCNKAAFGGGVQLFLYRATHLVTCREVQHAAHVHTNC